MERRKLRYFNRTVRQNEGIHQVVEVTLRIEYVKYIELGFDCSRRATGLLLKDLSKTKLLFPPLP
jgi:hypothetical protein